MQIRQIRINILFCGEEFKNLPDVIALEKKRRRLQARIYGGGGVLGGLNPPPPLGRPKKQTKKKGKKKEKKKEEKKNARWRETLSSANIVRRYSTHLVT